MQPHSFWSKNGLHPRQIPVFICLTGDCPVFFAKRWGFCELEFDGTIAHLRRKLRAKAYAGDPTVTK